MKRPLKPRVLGDISRKQGDPRSWSAFGPLAARVNLAEERVLRIPLVKTLRVGIIASAVAFLAFGSALAPTLFSKAANDANNGNSTVATSTDPTVQRTALETQLSQLEDQIDQYQGQITSYATQGKSLTSEIAMLNDKIASISLQIQATHLTGQQLTADIAQAQLQVATIQADIATKKAAMGILLQETYENGQVPLIQSFLENPQLSDFWNNTEDLTLVENNLRVTAQQITGLQSELQNEEDQFQAAESDAASVAAYQQAQTQEIVIAKSQESELLAETKGQESKYQTLLVETQASAAQTRNQIFQLLGGGQISFEDAYQYAQLASNATGIDPAFILAILDRESALGQNLGQCNYASAMSPSDQPLFLAITQSLGLNSDEMFVSCPNTDGAYGGAMGPAQFEPSTWDMYAPTVAKITGSDPPSPWNDADAFVAAALYLKDNMAGCAKLYTAAISEERCTAAVYYAGGDWKNYLWTYGEAVVEQAQTFASDIQTITNGGDGSGGNGSGSNGST